MLETKHYCSCAQVSSPSKEELHSISLLPTPSKICEGLMSQWLNVFLQFGGLKLSSTTAALVCIHDFITAALDNRQIVGVAVLAYDFSKAFDRLGHDTIVSALQANNFPSGFVQWVSSYLTNRSQIVKAYRISSQPLPVTSGVPQGSTFGPYFFNAVVGSLKPIHATTKIIKYIDDCTVYICSPYLLTQFECAIGWAD